MAKRFTLELPDAVMDAVDKQVAAMDGLLGSRNRYIGFLLAYLHDVPVLGDFEAMMEKTVALRTRLQRSRKLVEDWQKHA